MSNIRLPMALALLLTPDDRGATRRAIMRAALWLDASGERVLSRPARRRLLAGMGRGQRTWVGWGVAVFLMLRRRAGLAVVFVVAVLWLLWQAVSAVVGLFGSAG